MDEGSYLGIRTRYSATKKYRVDIHKETKQQDGSTLYSATITEKIRSYWQPVLSGIGLRHSEIEAYMEK